MSKYVAHYRHIGYYNNVSDLRMLCLDKDGKMKKEIQATDVIEAIFWCDGSFYDDIEPDETDIETIDFNIVDAVADGRILKSQVTPDGKYLITYDIDEDDLQHIGEEDFCTSSYIDVYEFDHTELKTTYYLKNRLSGKHFNHYYLDLGFKGDHKEMTLSFSDRDEAIAELNKQYERDDIKYLNFRATYEEELFSLSE